MIIAVKSLLEITEDIKMNIKFSIKDQQCSWSFFIAQNCVSSKTEVELHIKRKIKREFH